MSDSQLHLFEAQQYRPEQKRCQSYGKYCDCTYPCKQQRKEKAMANTAEWPLYCITNRTDQFAKWTGSIKEAREMFATAASSRPDGANIVLLRCWVDASATKNNIIDILRGVGYVNKIDIIQPAHAVGKLDRIQTPFIKGMMKRK